MNSSLTRRHAALAIATAAGLAVTWPGSELAEADDRTDPLPSWNDGRAKRAILEFVRITTDEAGPHYVPAAERFATFDQDGTTWVEHPMYTEVVFSLERIAALAPQHPAWKTTEPFKTVLSGDKSAMAKLTTRDLESIVAVTHAGMPVDAFRAVAEAWIAKARDPRWHRPYTELIYQPMLEVMRYLRSNRYETYIVTGGGQDFVRSYAGRAYGIPPKQVVGSAGDTRFTYGANGQSILTKLPKLLLNNNLSGKAEDIDLFLGARPRASFGNTAGDQEMLEYTQGGSGARLMMLVLHDDAKREYAYGPAAGLPGTKVGSFSQSLYDEAKAKGWFVISMRQDWNRIFSFEA
jgi:hypothetical protein